MSNCEDDPEIKDLLKKKKKLSKDHHRLGELSDTVFALGYAYFQKGYYKEALDEFQQSLDFRSSIHTTSVKSTNDIDLANSHRFLAETLCKLMHYKKAKPHLDQYHSIVLKVNDLVEIQRSHTTLGNYFMSLAEDKSLKNRKENLNLAYSHHLKAYDILNTISEKRLVDSKEFALMKARTCHNCACVLDDKRDLVSCNEYLKTAIEICEKNNFYEDLIRCYNLKCDQAKREGKMELAFKIAQKIISVKTKDYIQQAQNYLYVAEIYLQVKNFEKAKLLLRRAYKLRSKCLIQPEIKQKLKNVIKILHCQKKLAPYEALKKQDLNSGTIDIDDGDMYQITQTARTILNDQERERIGKEYEQMADSCCFLELYDLGLHYYLEQMKLLKSLSSSKDLATVYSSIAQTYQDLADLRSALKFYELEMKELEKIEDKEDPKTVSSLIKSLLNMAQLKDKLHVELSELRDLYHKAYDKAKSLNSLSQQMDIMHLLKKTEEHHEADSTRTQGILNSLKEIKKVRGIQEDKEEEEDEEDEEEDKSIIFSSESEEDEATTDELKEEMNQQNSSIRTKKRAVVKRNLRGETQLHVACIRGNYKLAKKLIEQGHPINERDNLGWLPIHEACNYGHLQLVELLIQHGAKVNDSQGPITPLHDSAQNGHLEVIRLLLRAGALSYVFNKEGYTPLDFLYKYKQDNEKDLSPSELQLANELCQTMLKAIREKDKSYKVKRVVIAEDSNYLAAEDQEALTQLMESKKKKMMMTKENINAEDDEVSSDDEDQYKSDFKSSRKKAISDYRNAIQQIGSKAKKSMKEKTSFKKDICDKVIVTEKEYNINDDWLINDMPNAINDKKKIRKNIDDDENEDELLNQEEEDSHHFTKTSKRKFKKSEEVFNEDTTSSSNSDVIMNTGESTLPKEDLNYDNNNINEDYLFNNDEYLSTSPISKKRLIEKKMSPVIIVGDDDDDESQESNKEFLIIEEPFKTIHNNSNNNIAKPKTKQMKLTKMMIPTTKPNVPQLIIKQKKKNSDETNNLQSSDLINNELLIKKPQTIKATIEEPQQQNWKIKAIMENRNFLIPISNINLTISDLTSQIVNRYKTIFCGSSGDSAATFREPDKVLLKNADDLILFGSDLIKDVLSDCSQVHLIIETWKDAPKISDLYEQLCSTRNLRAYANIKSLLMELSGDELNDVRSLQLNDLFSINNAAKEQLECIFESIKLNINQKQSDTLRKDYFRNLVRIDLSANCIDDQLAMHFIEHFFAEHCQHLKHLNFSSNFITWKSLKFIQEMNASNKFGGRSFVLETLNLSNNDIGSCSILTNSYYQANNSIGGINVLVHLKNILLIFKSLRCLQISNCKLNFIDVDNNDDNLMHGDNDEDNSINSFFLTIKNSKLENLDLSFNNMCDMFLVNLIEHLPNCQMQHLNLSNCVKGKKICLKNSAFTKFISYSLQSISFRNFHFNSEFSQCLLSNLSSNCKQLKHLDISFNSFKVECIRELFDECSKLEEAFLVNEVDNDDCQLLDLVEKKLNESSTMVMPLKCLEIRLPALSFDENSKSRISDLFRKKFHKNSLHVSYLTKEIIQFKII